MVSKSANYCFCSRDRNTGLLLLTEVALGDMYEKKEAEYVEKLPEGETVAGTIHVKPMMFPLLL